MSFDYYDYHKMLFLGPLIAIIIILILFVVETILFFKKNSSLGYSTSLKRYVASIIAFLFFLFVFLLPIKQGIHLINEKENDKVKTMGEITEIRKTYGLNKYTYEGHVTYASYVYIEDERYYIMNIGEYKVGDVVIIEYLPKSKIVLSINDIE